MPTDFPFGANAPEQSALDMLAGSNVDKDALDSLTRVPPPRIHERAVEQGYLERASISIDHVNGVVTADVPNGRGKTYDVTIDVEERGQHCTCPANENYPWPCKHVVAVALLALEEA